MENRVCDIKKNDKAWAFFYRPLNVWMTLTRVDVRLRTDYNEDDDYVADYLIAWGNNKNIYLDVSASRYYLSQNPIGITILLTLTSLWSISLMMR